MKNATFVLLITVFFWCWTPLPAAPADDILSWKDCVAEARQYNPDLTAAREQVNRAVAEKAIARGALLPQLSGFVGQSRTGSAIIDSETNTYGVTIQQLVFDSFKTPNDIAAASENIRTLEYNYAVNSSDIRFRLRTAFVELLRVQELLAITGRITKRRRQNVELVRLRYEAGREHKGSLLNAEANLAQAEFDGTQTKRSIILAQTKLARELGRRQFSSIVADGDLAPPLVDGTSMNLDQLADRNPLVRQTAARKEEARFAVKAARADLYPQVYANASAGRNSSDWPPEDNEWTVGISITIPLFEGGIRRAEVSRASAVLKEAEAVERISRNDVLVSLQDAWTRLQDAVQRVGVEQKFLEAANSRARIARAQYATGLISFDNWIIIEDDLVRAEKLLLAARAAAMTAEAEWIRAQGGTLDYAE